MCSGDSPSDNRLAIRRVREPAGLAIALWLVSAVGCSSLNPRHEVLHVDGEGYLGDSSHLVSQALHQYRKGHIDQAVSKFEQALAIDPDHGVAHNNLGLIHYEKRQLVQAANHFDVAIGLLPNDPRPINNLGMTLEAGGRVMDAIELYAEASGLDPDNPLYLGNWLRARARMGEHSEELIAQLEHLAFVETRADWLSWADEQLALIRNPVLDRGPAKPSSPNQGMLGSGAKRSTEPPPPNPIRENLPLESSHREDSPILDHSPRVLLPRGLSPAEDLDLEAESLPVPAPAPANSRQQLDAPASGP